MFVKRVLCSPILGTLLLKGQPLQGAQVVREVKNSHLPGGRLRDVAYTDNKGQFEFPTIAVRGFAGPGLFKSDINIVQLLNVDVEGYPYCVWAYSKRDYEPGSETGQPEIRLTCELSLPSDRARFREVEWVIEGALT